MSNKFKILIAIIALALAGLGFYFGYYVPRTPAYTLTLIKKGIDAKDPAAVFKQVNIDAIVDNAVDRELKDSKAANDPLARSLVKLLKPVAKSALKELAAQEITGQDRTPDPTITDGAVSALQDLTVSYKDQNKIKVKGLNIHVDKDNICTYTVNLENPKTGQSTKIDLLARQLDDGTWEIFDIPNITNIRDIKIGDY